MDQPPLNNHPDETPQSDTTPPTPPEPAMWTATDSWLGLGLLLIFFAAFFIVIAAFEQTQSLSIFVVASFEFILLAPIAIILFLRKIPWRELGLYNFDRKDLLIGFALLAGVYILVIINNLVMLALGVVTQADVISDMLGEIDAPYLFAFVTAIVAPVTEELFFRGFLFKGLSRKYGWINALMFSAIIFALFHGQIATLIPTFLLGALFAYLAHRTGSIFPGMILHFTVNSLGVCVLLTASQMGLM